jgi:hypothetical protein
MNQFPSDARKVSRSIKRSSKGPPDPEKKPIDTQLPFLENVCDPMKIPIPTKGKQKKSGDLAADDEAKFLN